MRVAILNDLFPAPGVGSGAELSIRYMAKEGILRGHDIDFYTARTYTRPLDDYDLVVLKNVVSFGADQLEKVMLGPYVTWPSDYAFCKWRLFYSMQEKCRSCDGVAMARRLFTNSVLNVFLSPLHREAYLHAIPEIADLESLLSPPYVADRFLPISDVERLENTVIGVNCLLPFKGVENVVKYAADHPEMSFNFYGGVRDGWEDRLPDNAFYFGYAPQHALPVLYSQASHFIHLPSTPMPFDRTVIEAILCGVKNLIVNKNVGAMSYDWVRRKSCRRESVINNMEMVLLELWGSLEDAAALMRGD